MIPGSFPIVAGAGRPVLEYVTFSNQNTASTTHTHASISLGQARPDKVNIVTIANRSASSLSSVTIGGVTATLCKATTPAPSAEIWVAEVPNTTSGDIVIVSGSTFSLSTVGVYAAYGLLSITPTNSVSDSADPISLPIDIETDGIVISTAQSSSGAALASWTNATEDYDATGTPGRTGASYQATSSEAARAVSMTGLTGTVTGCAAAFR